MTTLPTGKTSDPKPEATTGKKDGTMASAGKQFYSWATIMSFGGATAIVVTAWTVLSNLDKFFATQWTPFIASFVVVGAIALFTEPSVTTRRRDKGQKAFQAIVNGFMVSSASMGLNGMGQDGSVADQPTALLQTFLAALS
ncbi:MAG: hypothetical protein ACE5OQ_15895 [Woeseia sp.]